MAYNWTLYGLTPYIWKWWNLDLQTSNLVSGNLNYDPVVERLILFTIEKLMLLDQSFIILNQFWFHWH